jgi:hypothetical protein
VSAGIEPVVVDVPRQLCMTVQPSVARQSSTIRLPSDSGTTSDNYLTRSRRNPPCNDPCNRTR